jgi:thioredoxin reductase/NAD-dependent dihydropyrimidine dehydrogenase PreA subunit
MDESTLLASGLLYVLPLLGALLVYRVRRRRRLAAGLSARAETESLGLAEPPSLHPAINPIRCLGCGACVRACPEGDVLGVIHGRAELLNPTSCIGHGACQAACPFDAITLVLGSERRGVDIPMLGPDFQTNVPGVYVAGELGGMGLVRNAVSQGRQAVDAIASRARTLPRPELDLVVVGAGPAGIAASLAARERGLRTVTLEQESVGGSVMHYPRGKLVTTSPVALPLGGRLRGGRIEKQELLEFWTELLRRARLRIREGERVEAVEAGETGLEVRTSRGRFEAGAVLLAIGRRGMPKGLGVAGERLPKVAYQLADAEAYRGQRVLVVGGGDAALEAAVALAAQPGTRVTLSYRGEGFVRARRENRQALEAECASGRIEVLLGSEVTEIDAGAVRLRSADGPLELANDAVLLCLGGTLPTDFLREIGVEVETLRGTPLAATAPVRRHSRWRRRLAAS